MVRTACFLILLLTTVFAPQDARAQQSEVIAELRSSLFESANSALDRANAGRANLLSPTNYATGAEYYQIGRAHV